MLYIIKNTIPKNISKRFWKAIKNDPKRKIFEKLDIKKKLLKEPQTISIYWFYLLRNHADTSTKSK